MTARSRQQASCNLMVAPCPSCRVRNPRREKPAAGKARCCAGEHAIKFWTRDWELDVCLPQKAAGMCSHPSQVRSAAQGSFERWSCELRTRESMMVRPRRSHCSPSRATGRTSSSPHAHRLLRTRAVLRAATDLVAMRFQLQQPLPRTSSRPTPTPCDAPV